MQDRFQEFLNDYGSTTKRFKEISKNNVVEVLFSGVTNNNFQRIVSIFLDNISIMVAISETNITNATFLQILQDSANNPIGEKLFESSSGIKRINMQISTISLQQITNQVIYEYLHQLGYNIQQVFYIRKSQFILNNEFMQLTEYILPSLLNLLQ